VSGERGTIRRVVSLLGAVLLVAQATSIEVRVPAPAGTLGGTLTLPAGRGPFPAVTTLTGSGAHYRDGNRTPDHPYRDRKSTRLNSSH